MRFKVNIKTTLGALLAQEDTDGDKKITIEDQGPKSFVLKDEEGKPYEIKGTYYLSNLLQELVLAIDSNQETTEISITNIEELPTQRISRMIREYYWNGLTRTMDEHGIQALLSDSKNETLGAESLLRVYVHYKDDVALDYYMKLKSAMPLEVIQLPKKVTPKYVKKINNKPGILALKLSEKDEEAFGEPFVVPGGRFNEMYGWDSYFESIGLLLDGRTDLATGMANNFQYEVEYYGKILNANRSYYLTRTQPPFYSSLIAEIFEKTHDKNWLKSHLQTAIKEYETVWMVTGKRLTENGLNRYLAEGIGKPPEAEEGHFHHEIGPYAKAEGMSVQEYEKQYAKDKIKNPKLDAYFVHDRSVRESGHDTSYRLEGICADLNVVELNAFLYKYETDFAEIIAQEFEDSFKIGGKEYTSAYWLQKATERKDQVNKLLWNEEKGMYFDYNFRKKEQTNFISATVFTPLWAKMCSQEQAQKVIQHALPLLKEKGGIASCTKESRGEISKERPQKQWDYPNGWAPHQMMLWRGLQHYGFHSELQELVYRWLFMITKNAVDYNGTIPEKYDVVSATHKVFAEYGNVGTEFEYITKEGFGWMNASYQLGLSLLDSTYISKLNELTTPETIFNP
ncbi:MAG: alpha,alpha-trehalase [Flavobacteriaceae bacterium]|nr:trehalase [Flavobacteriaceae bacterium]